MGLLTRICNGFLYKSQNKLFLDFKFLSFCSKKVRYFYNWNMCPSSLTNSNCKDASCLVWRAISISKPLLPCLHNWTRNRKFRKPVFCKLTYIIYLIHKNVVNRNAFEIYLQYVYYISTCIQYFNTYTILQYVYNISVCIQYFSMYAIVQYVCNINK